MNNKPILIVLDASIWISSRLLKSSTAAALLYSVRKLPARILLPEVTHEELVHGIVVEGLRAVQRIENAYVTIQTLIGKRPDYHLPTQDDFLEVSKARLKELDDLIQHAPMTLDYFSGALRRVIAALPPSDRTEQFRDSILWEAILAVAPSAEILFASEDSDFYRGHDLKQGLAPGIGVRSILLT